MCRSGETVQTRQKTAYYRSAKTADYSVGDGVMVHMPYVPTGKTAKCLCRSMHDRIGYLEGALDSKVKIMKIHRENQR